MRRGWAPGKRLYTESETETRETGFMFGLLAMQNCRVATPLPCGYLPSRHLARRNIRLGYISLARVKFTRSHRVRN